MAYLRCTGNTGGSLKLRTASGRIATFETNMVDVLQEVKCEIKATGGNGTPDNPNPINGFSEVNIVNTQNESIVDLFSIDSDFRGTVAFNQLIQNGNFANTDNWTFPDAFGTMSIANNKATLNLTSNNQNMSITQLSSDSVYSGHVYFEKIDVTCSKVIRPRIGYSGDNVTPSVYMTPNVANQKTTCYCFHKLTNSSGATPFKNYIYFNLNPKSLDSGDTIVFENAQIFDLTAMFGSTIADYIYSLEQATAGAGVAFFRSIYPADYYDYDSGTNELVGKITPNVTLNLGQTVYGGQLIITPDRTYFHATWKGVDADTLTWAINSAADHIFVTNFTDIKPTGVEYSDRKEGALCSHYPADSQFTISQNMHNETWLRLAKQFFIRNNAYSTINDFVASLTDVMIAYVLETPFDIDLTPRQIEALIGVNNVWHDGNGNTEVKYLYNA